MKAEIDNMGRIAIKPETDNEKWALSVWHEDSKGAEFKITLPGLVVIYKGEILIQDGEPPFSEMMSSNV